MYKRVILALDLATCTGWAQATNNATPAFGSISFLGDLGEKASALDAWLTTKLKTDLITNLYIEAPLPMRGRTSLATLLWLYGAQVVARKVACDLHVPVEAVNCNSWRAHFLGCTRAPSDVPKTKRRAWLKRAAMDACRKRHWDVKTDDEADALGLLSYARSEKTTGKGRTCQKQSSRRSNARGSSAFVAECSRPRLRRRKAACAIPS